MIYINNSKSPYSEQKVSLGGKLFTLTLKFNVRNNSWYMTLSDSADKTPLIEGIKLQPNQNLTGRYTGLPIEGSIWCIRINSDSSPITSSNLGAGESYRLAWMTDRESVLMTQTIERGVLRE